MVKAGAVLEHPVVVSAAEKLGKTPAQVALRWGVQMGHSVLPKSTNKERIRANIDVYDWSIPDDLFAKLSEIEQASGIRNSEADQPAAAAARQVCLTFPCLLVVTVILQERLIRASFFVHPEGVFKSVEEFWDGEI
jgi:hypothetical protein